MQIRKFVFDLLVLVRNKTKMEKTKEHQINKRSKSKKGQLVLDGVKSIVEDYLTVVQETRLGPVILRTNKFDIIQNMVIDRTSYGSF